PCWTCPLLPSALWLETAVCPYPALFASADPYCAPSPSFPAAGAPSDRLGLAVPRNPAASGSLVPAVALAGPTGRRRYWGGRSRRSLPRSQLAGAPRRLPPPSATWQMSVASL